MNWEIDCISSFYNNKKKRPEIIVIVTKLNT